jgi:2-succinyl-6-hydroxy-2,4-cyclohexadiene-1-carboxylate synthase
MRVPVNGIHLNVEEEGSGPPLLLLHGFTGSAGSWRALQQALPSFRTIAVDVIGHGASDSPDDASRYTMAGFIADLAALLDALGIEKTALLGYSMGGRIALRFALAHPERLSALVLESASPGIADAEERRARVRSDVELADRMERDGLEAFVDYWQSIPLWESQKRLPEEQRAALRRQRLTNSVRGLANSLRCMGAGADEDVTPRLGELGMPSLLIAGALDVRYAEVVRRMAAATPNAEALVVEGAGHAVHFERPEVFNDSVGAFLRRTVAPVAKASGSATPVRETA